MDEEYKITICEEYLPLLGNVEHMPNVKVEIINVDSQLKMVDSTPYYAGFRKFIKGLPRDDRNPSAKEKHDK